MNKLDHLDDADAARPSKKLAGTFAYLRKGQPHLPPEELLALARAQSADLPDLREPKKPGQSPVPVRERIELLLERLREVPAEDRRRISGIVSAEKRALFSFYELRYVRNRLTVYRQAVRDVFGEGHPAFKYLHLNDGDQTAVNTLDRKQVEIRRRSLRPIDDEYLIDHALQLIHTVESQAMFRIGVGLALLTGRRPHELYSTATFEYVDDDHVRFGGQAKGPKDKAKPPLPPYVIPVLTDASDVIDAFRRMRRERNLVGSDSVNSIVAHPMKDVCVTYRVQDEFGNTLTPKELRASYAEICYAYFAPKSISKDVYFADILGHNDMEATSAKSYMKVYIVGRLGDAQASNALALRSLATKLHLRLKTEIPPQSEYTLRDIEEIESKLDDASRDAVHRAAGIDVDAAIAARAKRVRDVAMALSPAQDRLLREVANGRTAVLQRDRRPLETLLRDGVVSIDVVDDVEVLTLTDFGESVRAELPPDEEAGPTGTIVPGSQGNPGHDM